MSARTCARNEWRLRRALPPPPPLPRARRARPVPPHHATLRSAPPCPAVTYRGSGRRGCGLGFGAQGQAQGPTLGSASELRSARPRHGSATRFSASRTGKARRGARPSRALRGGTRRRPRGCAAVVESWGAPAGARWAGARARCLALGGRRCEQHGLDQSTATLYCYQLCGTPAERRAGYASTPRVRAAPRPPRSLPGVGVGRWHHSALRRRGTIWRWRPVRRAPCFI